VSVGGGYDMTDRHTRTTIFTPPIKPKGSRRIERVADMIQHEISLLLLGRIKDPRLINVSVIQVIVTKDLRRAKIFYSVYGDEQKATAAEQGLSSARGFIRKHLADHLGLRVTPELVFERDLSLIRQEEMERLFKELHSEDDAAE
jgi:ribosome-binding factor A